MVISNDKKAILSRLIDMSKRKSEVRGRPYDEAMAQAVDDLQNYYTDDETGDFINDEIQKIFSDYRPGRIAKGARYAAESRPTRAVGRAIGAGFAGAIGPKGSLRFRDPIYTGIKARIWDSAVIWTIAIVIAILGVEAGFEKLAYAVVFYGIYKILPDEYDVIASASQKFARRMQRERIAQGFEDWTSPVFQDAVRSSSGLLTVKSAVKFMAVLTLLAQMITFATIPLMPFFALMLLFVYYFSLPTSYSVDRPWRAIEAWTRMIVGVLLADFLWAMLSGTTGQHFAEVPDIFIALITVSSSAVADFFYFISPGVQGSPASALFFLAIAFFATLPTKEEYR